VIVLSEVVVHYATERQGQPVPWDAQDVRLNKAERNNRPQKDSSLLDCDSIRTDWPPGFVLEVFGGIDPLIRYANLKEMCPRPEQRCGEPLRFSIGV
jgi:hypothetical protein